MARFLHDRQGRPRFRFGLSKLMLAVVWGAVVFALHARPWLAAGVGSLLIVIYLHVLSLGRTTPLAAFTYVFGFFLLGLVIGLPYAHAESNGKAYVQQITEQHFANFFLAIACAPMVLAAIVAVVASIEKRDEWFNHLRRLY